MASSSSEAPASMSEAQRALVAEEDAARQLFAEQPQHERLQDAHLLLHRVFDGAESTRYAYAREDPEEARVPKLLTQTRELDLQGSAIVSRAQFDANLQEFTQGCFQGLDWSHVFMAGGAVLGALQSRGSEGYKSSDIDLFVHGVADEREANGVLRHVYETVLRNTRGKGDVVRSHRALTVLCAYPYRHVQIVLRLYKSPAEVLLGFDIDACCVGYDGTDVWAMERFRRALTKRYNLVNVSRRSLTYEQRLAKYAKRGFAVAVPNLDKRKVDRALLNKRPADAQGLSKLLVYDFQQQQSSQGIVVPRHRSRAAVNGEEEGSDYNGDVTLPWGPQWQNDAIINLVHAQHKARFFSTLRRQPQPASTQHGDSTNKQFEHVLTSDARELQASEFTAWQRSLDKKRVTQPLTWIKDSPAYQDYDNGFRRLMTGSFEPVVDANWEKGAYTDLENQRADPSLLSRTDGSAKDVVVRQNQKLPFVAQAAPTSAPAKPMKSFGVNNAALKKAKLASGKKKPLPKKGAKYNPAKKRARDEDFDDEESMSGDDDEESEAPPRLPPAKQAPLGNNFGFGYSAQPMQQTTPTDGGFASVNPSVAAFGGPSSANTSMAGFSYPPSAYSNPATPPRQGSYAITSASLADFGGPSSFAAVPSTPVRSAPSGYTMNNFGGYASAVPFGNNVIDTPSRGLGALGPQPGASFGFSTAPSPIPPSAPISSPVPVFTSAGLAPPSASSAPAFGSSTSKLLLLIALFHKQGRLSPEEKGKLKDRVLRQDSLVQAALDVFEIDQDLEELCDTLRRITAL